MFEVGDYVYASDWCYGRIIDLDYDGAFIEFETTGGGGSCYFYFDEITKA